MKVHHFENMSVEEMINEAIDRELSLLAYYRTAATTCGNHAAAFFLQCCTEQEGRISGLESLLTQIEEIRDVSLSMAD